VGETLHNLGEASLKAGDYGQSLDYHLKALDLFRNSGDKSGAAIQSYSIGTIFEYQGRYGAALKSKEEALKTFRELNDRSFWMGEILSGYGNSLSEVGRYDEAQKNLTEAMSLAKELQNKTLIAQILNFQGDTFYYRGDIKAASDLFAQAIAASSADVEKDVALLSKYNAARCIVEEKRYQAAVAPLKAVIAEADAAGLKNISTEATLALAAALMNTRQYPAARKELDTALSTSEKMGLQVLQARSQYLLGAFRKHCGRPVTLRRSQARIGSGSSGIRQRRHPQASGPERHPLAIAKLDLSASQAASGLACLESAIF
jgi:eukaryotic-like serine/threonine-protein kinase